jgi:putative MFS transporter
VALSLAALCWGLINFGLLLWLPGDLQEKGYSVTVASTLLAKSALISFPTVFLCAFLYSRWSTKWSLVTMIAITMVGLGLVVHLEVAGRGSPVLPVSLLIVGSNGILAILLPYAAESFPLNVRGRATGWVAACTKAGGVGAQGLAITALVPSMGSAAIAIMLPTTLALALIARFGRETRGTDLRDLDVDSGPFGHGSISRS